MNKNKFMKLTDVPHKCHCVTVRICELGNTEHWVYRKLASLFSYIPFNLHNKSSPSFRIHPRVIIYSVVVQYPLARSWYVYVHIQNSLPLSISLNILSLSRALILALLLPVSSIGSVVDSASALWASLGVWRFCAQSCWVSEHYHYH